jgi:large subunit ribosomal protein L6
MLFVPKIKNIKVKIYKNSIKLVGPLGEIIKKKSKNIKLLSQNNKIIFLKGYSNLNQVLLMRAMLNVVQGYYFTLLIQGVGYKMFILENKLRFRLGFSNDIIYNIPKNIKIFFLAPNKIIIFGNNLQKVAQTAAEIRLLKAPEPYKGKGIRYQNEIIKLKIGKPS